MLIAIVCAAACFRAVCAAASAESRSRNSLLHGDPIAWLQSRIGSYDVAHDLEPLVQKSVLKGLKHVPKRSGRIKTELIDLGETARMYSV